MSTASAAGRPNGRVLVVDTDHSRQALLADVVARTGAEVVLAGSGVEAMERLSTRRPDIVLVADLDDGSARGFLAWAGPRHPDISLVAIADDIEDATELYHLGADLVETLPLDPDRLGAKLAATTRRFAARGNAAVPVDGEPALLTQAA
jgi:DNA-binding response OmpR family regulator